MNTAPETSELKAFVRIADVGSLSGAARELELPRATISRRLSRLEERLGVRLVRRTTRQLRLTDAGEELYRHAREIVLAVDAAAQAVRRDDGEPRGLLRVSTPPMDDAILRGILLDFVARYPEVELELIASTRHEDLVARNIDVAWRASVDLDPGLIARRLMSTELIAVASPAYLDRAGAPASPDDLMAHHCLVGFTRGERPATHWPLLSGGQVRVRGRLISNDLRALHDAARRGLGVALLPRVFCAADLAAGSLRPVLPGALGAPSHVSLVFPDRKLLKPAVRAFIDHMVASIGDLEDLGGVGAQDTPTS